MKRQLVERINSLHGRVEATLGLCDDIPSDVKATLEDTAETLAALLNSTEAAESEEEHRIFSFEWDGLTLRAIDPNEIKVDPDSGMTE
jgi:hypothetical protein